MIKMVKLEFQQEAAYAPAILHSSAPQSRHKPSDNILYW